MNYRHAYHAGNAVDVFKHIVLIALLQSMMRKDNAFCYLDTHAGEGQYDLFSQAAQKSQEFASGIAKIFAADNPPSLVQDYLACVQSLNTGKQLRFYPGSPLIAKTLLRTQDRLVLSDKHAEDYLSLKKKMANDKRILTHYQDGYTTLKASLPPKERRGLILIDPPYEQPDEWKAILTALHEALKRFETGVYAIWYPIKDRRTVESFYRKVAETIQRPHLITELTCYPDDTTQFLNGSGMIVINPPWKLDTQLEATLPWLWKNLSPNHQGQYGVRTIG